MRIAARLKFAWPWLAMLVVALYLYRAAGQFVFAPRPGELGPDFWPRAVLVLLIAVCVVRAAGFLLGWSRAEPAVDEAGGSAAAQDGGEAKEARSPSEGEAVGADLPEPPRYPRLLLGGVGLTILYVLTMGTLGFLLGTALYLALFMLIGRYRRPFVIAVTSIVGSLVFVYVFMKIVYVSLPLGTGPFQQLSLAVLAAIGVH